MIGTRSSFRDGVVATAFAIGGNDCDQSTRLFVSAGILSDLPSSNIQGIHQRIFDTVCERLAKLAEATGTVVV